HRRIRSSDTRTHHVAASLSPSGCGRYLDVAAGRNLSGSQLYRSAQSIAKQIDCGGGFAQDAEETVRGSLMPSDALLHQIGLNVDRIISCDLLSYGAIGPLFERAEARQGGPLSLKAARLLREALSEGGTLLLTTGLILPGQYPH